MRVLFRLALICVLVLSGVALGSARGQMRVAGTVVLCAGSAVTELAVDINGKPVAFTHVCPDMALSLMAAIGGPAILPARDDGAGATLAADTVAAGQVWRIAAPPRARGPPVAG